MIDGLKPYPAMKESGVPWLGDVPQHWEVRKIREVARVINGYPFDAARFSQSSGYPLIRIRDLDRAKTATRYDGPFVEAAKVEPGDVLIGMDGDFNVGTWRGAEPALLNQRMCCLRSTEPVTERLLAYALPRPLMQINEVTWSTTVKHLASGQVERIEFGFPPLPEQAAIVRFLDHADRRIRRYIRAKQKLIKLLEEQKQAIIQGIVTRGLDPNVRLKPSGLKWLWDVPEHWGIERTKNLFRLRIEKSGINHGLELLSIYTHIGVRPRRDLEEKGNKASTTDNYWIVRKGDLIVNKLLAWMGAVGVSEFEGVTSPAYDILKRIRPLCSAYFHYLFRTKLYLELFKQRSRGIMDMRLRLYFDQLGQIPALVPPLPEQEAIVSAIGTATLDLERTVKTTQREIALLLEYRARLIADLVTGKLDVREAAARVHYAAEAPETFDEANAEGAAEEPDADDADVVPEETEA